MDCGSGFATRIQRRENALAGNRIETHRRIAAGNPALAVKPRQPGAAGVGRGQRLRQLRSAEQRAEAAERELVKLRLLTFMSERIGMETEAVITGVADYGFFAEAQTLPVEGLVHVSTLSDDYYYYDDVSHTLTGRRTKKRYRLGDKVKVTVVRVDLNRRQLDFRVTDVKRPDDVPETPRRPARRPQRRRHSGD